MEKFAAACGRLQANVPIEIKRAADDTSVLISPKLAS